MKSILLASCLALTANAVDTIIIPAFNADSIPLARGTAVAVQPTSNGGFTRASSGSISTCAFGLLAADAGLGIASQVITSGEITLPDWTVIAGVSALSPGSYYFVGNAGKLTSASSGTAQIIGIAISQTTLLIHAAYLAQSVYFTNSILPSGFRYTNTTTFPIGSASCFLLCTNSDSSTGFKSGYMLSENFFNASALDRGIVAGVPVMSLGCTWSNTTVITATPQASISVGMYLMGPGGTEPNAATSITNFLLVTKATQ